MPPTSVKELIEKDAALLEGYKKEFKDNPASQLIGKALSPHRAYLSASLLGSASLASSETYVRSGKHPLTKNTPLFTPPEIQAQNLLANGGDAHIGNYQNIMQAWGNVFKPSDTELPTTTGNTELYHSMLSYKNNICRYIADAFAGDKKLSHIVVSFCHDYPCVMVHVKPGSANAKRLTEAAFAEWVNLIASVLVGYVNYEAYAAGLPIELIRRSSFGFLTPTISATAESFRISVGLIPRVYANILISSLRNLDTVLQMLKRDTTPTPAEVFYGSEKHKKYLGKKYPPKMPDTVPLTQLLFEQVEKNGKTTVQNIARTAYARDGISVATFTHLAQNHSEYPQAFLSGIKWAISKIFIKTGTRPTLSFAQEFDISYGLKFPKTASIVKERFFWEAIQNIINAARSLKAPLLKQAIARLENCAQTLNIDLLYYHLEFLNELIFITALQNAREKEYGDGYGSDSSTEDAISQPGSKKTTRIYAKKLIVHNGMRAILSAISAAASYLEPKKSVNVFLQGAYYETTPGVEISNGLGHMNVKVTNLLSAAHIVVRDLNPCITTGTPMPAEDYSALGSKIVILDSTSATEQQVHQYLAWFSESRSLLLFVVDSGFKHQQMGADKNQYGTVRIFTKDRKLREQIYTQMKKDEPPVLSPTSHELRQTHKKLGNVPTTQAYFRPKVPRTLIFTEEPLTTPVQPQLFSTAKRLVIPITPQDARERPVEPSKALTGRHRP